MGLLGTAIASDTIEDSFDLTLHRKKNQTFEILNSQKR